VRAAKANQLTVNLWVGFNANTSPTVSLFQEKRITDYQASRRADIQKETISLFVKHLPEYPEILPKLGK
jgi:hypothetical protein